MQEVLEPLELADYHFLIGIIESPINLTDDQKLKSLLAAYEAEETPERRDALNRQLERSTRYLGSSDVAYFLRRWTTAEPGVPFHEIMRDVAGALKVKKPQVGTQREMLEDIVTQYATQQFAKLPDEEKQKMLENLGLSKSGQRRLSKNQPAYLRCRC